LAAHEINFDGIVGPTHNYAGLSFGNVASMTYKSSVSSPKRAALEGLAKMKFLMGLGVKQAVLPPHERPHLQTLRARGFTGTDAQILEKVYREDARLLAAVSSASAMWAANAATVSPSADARDRRVHFTPANLVSNLHRSIEAPTTTRILRIIFADEKHFVVHDPLPATLPDEGAANHTRLVSQDVPRGIELFAFGRAASEPNRPAPRRFPARQTLEASQAIARAHQLDPSSVIYLHQHPDAIDAGAFHNDVVAVGNENLLLYHQRAYVEPLELKDIRILEVPETAIPLTDAVSTYLFNSQLVRLPDGSISLIAPVECQQNARVKRYLEQLTGTGALESIHFVDVRQSMRNGGGPACLRLRVVLTDEEIRAMSGNVMLTDALHDQLKAWIERHYRDELRPDDLRDPKLLDESRTALDELTQILQLGRLYESQQP
jgi:succinylarginine dihydrolase